MAPLSPSTSPFEQWLLFEEQANFAGYQASTRPFPLEVAAIARARVEVRIGADAPSELVERFARADVAMFPRHPLNRAPSVAFSDEAVAERWPARFTSSRTLVVWNGLDSRPFAVKLATDHPHTFVCQPEKIRLAPEIDESLRFAAHVRAVDARLGADPELVLLTECLGITVPGSESGVLVRDLTPLCGEGTWLPGFAIPFVGREIARQIDEPFEPLFAESYAALLGRAKAKLLWRYGLQYQTPNPQNLLIELDQKLRPTGRIALRDLADCDLATDLDSLPGTPETRLAGALAPETRNSFWAFDQAGPDAVPRELVDAWCARHDSEYLRELARVTGGAQPPGTSSSGNALHKPLSTSA